jgi:hypothetical protein
MAVGGDTLTLPIGTFTWSSGVSISKSITLQGAGIGQTVIKDAVQGNPLIQCTLPANSLTRITGIEFQDGGRVNYNNTPGWIHIDGKNTDGSTVQVRSQSGLSHERRYGARHGDRRH